MNVESVSYNTFPSIGYAISASQNGMMSLPVSESHYIYSHFKHVSGVLAPDGVQGVNINRLKIIDTLIERLTQIKGQPEPLLNAEVLNDEEHVNAMIEALQDQIRTIQETRANSTYTLAPPQTWVLFNIFA